MKDIRLDSPLQGELIALQEVNDPVFSGGDYGARRCREESGRQGDSSF